MCWWFSLVFPHIERWPRSNKHLFQHNGESKWATKKYGKQCKYINRNLSNLSPALDFWNPAVFIFCFSTWGLLPKEISRMLSFGKTTTSFYRSCVGMLNVQDSENWMHLGFPYICTHYKLEGTWKANEPRCFATTIAETPLGFFCCRCAGGISWKCCWVDSVGYVFGG